MKLGEEAGEKVGKEKNRLFSYKSKNGGGGGETKKKTSMRI